MHRRLSLCCAQPKMELVPVRPSSAENTAAGLLSQHILRMRDLLLGPLRFAHDETVAALVDASTKCAFLILLLTPCCSLVLAWPNVAVPHFASSLVA